jgi:hypothetical protein
MNLNFTSILAAGVLALGGLMAYERVALAEPAAEAEGLPL